jgi:hypothetical protein
MDKKYKVQKEWEFIKKEIEELNASDLKNILIKGRYPNNRTFPPLYKLKNYQYSNNQIEYLCPRKNKTPRKYLIPDKNNYEKLVDEIVNCWETKENLFNSINTHSIKDLILSNNKVIPVSSCFLRENLSKKYLDEVCIDTIYKWKYFNQKYLYEDSINFQFLLKIDIKDFYSQIYTHSIPWALTGDKMMCKKYKNDRDFKKLSCCKLDEALRNIQDTQTNGIPIGPLGSDIIAEMIMCRIVKNVEEKNKTDFVGIRFRDDIKILCLDEKQANELLDCFALESHNFNLYFNDEKTEISENTSQIVSKGWFRKLASLPSINFDLKNKDYSKGNLINLDNDLMNCLLKIEEIIHPNEGNFWYELNKKYNKYFKLIIEKYPEGKERIIVWLLKQLKNYTQHTGEILYIIFSLISSNEDIKYLKLIADIGKRISMKRHYDLCMLWIVYFMADNFFKKGESSEIYEEIKENINCINNNDVKKEANNLIKHIENNKEKFMGKKILLENFKKIPDYNH